MEKILSHAEDFFLTWFIIHLTVQKYLVLWSSSCQLLALIPEQMKSYQKVLFYYIL